MSAMKNKQDFISELFCQTNLGGGGGRNPPFGGLRKNLFFSRLPSDLKFERCFWCVMDVQKNVS